MDLFCLYQYKQCIIYKHNCLFEMVCNAAKCYYIVVNHTLLFKMRLFWNTTDVYDA
jgi:hypothetical protein